MIRGIAQANKQIPIKLVIAGDGPERLRLESMAHALTGGPNIEFVGIVDDMQAFWQHCDVAATVPTSFIESFSMVTLEAMASGRPIIATLNGAIPELIVDGESGTLVPPGDVESLTRALINYADQPNLRRAHGTAGRARAIERFHIEDCALAYLDLFAELTSNQRHGPFKGMKAPRHIDTDQQPSSAQRATLTRIRSRRRGALPCPPLSSNGA